jgi:acyl-CoA thioester hydrolase
VVDERPGAAPASLTIERRIELFDTDAYGEFHYTTAFRLAEAAENALLERLGLLAGTSGRFPRVHVEADLRAPFGHRDLVECSVAVDSVGRTSVTYAFEIRRGGELCVEGRIVGALLDENASTRPWPDEWRRLLLEAGPQAPELLVVG